MPFVFLLLMLAALVGLIRPYKAFPAVQRWHYAVAALVSFFGIGVTAPPPEGAAPARQQAASASENTSTAAAPDGEPKGARPASKWTYDTQRDEMRGTESHHAILESENEINFDFPYGKQKGFLEVRRNVGGLDVMFFVRSGQILCHGFRESFISAKFDAGPIRRFRCTGSSDGSSEVAFLTDPRTFLDALKGSSRTVIEAEFFQHGRQQYQFDTRNLNWE